MATRRARIQIKPNTGPRPAAKVVAVDKSPTAAHKSNPLSPVKTTPLLPSKIPSQQPTSQTPPQAHEAATKPILSPQTAAAPTRPPVSTTARRVLQLDTYVKTADGKEAEDTNVSISDPPKQSSSDGKGKGDCKGGNRSTFFLPKGATSKQSDNDRKENGDSASVDNKQMCNGSVATPVQRTRLKKQAPKIPSQRKSQPKVDTTRTHAPETETAPAIPEAPEVVPEDLQNFDEIDASALTFKKPEIPKKKSQPTKETPPVSANSTTSGLEVTVNKASSTRKSKPRDNEGSRNVQKYKTSFKPTDPPDRSKMTIMDLIHWNPINNPMKRSIEPERPSSSPSLEPDPEPDSDINDTSKLKERTEKEDVVPGPRVIVGEDGQITLDESSLVIEQTAPVNDLSQEVVYETSDTTYSSYSKRVVTRQFWSMKDTAMFYKALSIVGTDFALMAKFFPKRTRADLKRKFKKEERTRMHLLDKAVSEWHNFDLEDIQDFLFCKEPRPLDSQDEEEARVDNPDCLVDNVQLINESFSEEPNLNNDSLSEEPQPNSNSLNEGPRQKDRRLSGPHLNDKSLNGRPCANNYVRDNLMNVSSRGRGRRISQGNKKSKVEKEICTQKKRRSNKRPPSRNAWSDEDAEPVDDDIDVSENGVEEVEEPKKATDEHDESCDCCKIRTKTTKRQHVLEAKKRKIEELEQEKTRFLENTISMPVQEAPQSPPPDIPTSHVPFTVITNRSTVITPVRPVNSIVIPSPTNAPVMRSPTPSRISSNSPVNLSPVPSGSGVIRENRTPATTKMYVINGASAANLQKNGSTNPEAGSSLHNQTQTTPRSVNILNKSSPVLSTPILQALLNRASPAAGRTPGQFVLVADKTPNNEQVFHVYLVSPNPTNSVSPNAAGPSKNVNVNPETLRRLGIRPIAQQNEKPDDKPEGKT